MTIENLTPGLLVVAGFAVFVCGLIWHNHLRRPLDLSLNKLGFTFKADTLAFVLLLGAGLMISGAVLWNQGYETKLANKDEQMKALRGEMQGMEGVFSQFKEVSLRFFLVFPADDDPEDVFETTIRAFVVRSGERQPKPYELINVDTGGGGIVVELQKVSLGDRVFIIAEYDGKVWRSARMVMPAGHLNLTRMPAQ